MIKEHEKKMRQFDGSAASVKKIQKPIKCEPLDQRRVIKDFVESSNASQAKSVFNSKTDRFTVKQNQYLNMANNPGPQDYEVNSKEPQYIIKGPVDVRFGSTFGRNSLLERESQKSPFRDRSADESPAPG